MATLEDVRQAALSLPGAYERVAGDRFKFKVDVVVFATVSPDETMMPRPAHDARTPCRTSPTSP